MSGTFQVIVKRTRSDSPPESLDFGEVAFSDLNDAIHIGKFDGSILSGFLSPTPDGGGSTSPHTHDLLYAPLDHNHDSAYAPLAHNHDSAYAPLAHNHDSAYAPLAHNHDSAYAPLAHTHAGIALLSFSFNGTVGGLAILASFDPGERLAPAITRNAAGQYEIAISGLTTSPLMTHGWGQADGNTRAVSLWPTAGLLTIRVRNTSNSLVDLDYCCVTIFAL